MPPRVSAILAQEPGEAYAGANIDWMQAAGSSLVLGGLQHPWMASITAEAQTLFMRAKPTAGAAPWSSGGYIFSYGGEIVYREGRVAFDSEAAVAAIEMYAKTLRDGGPLGVGNYDWYESLEDYKQGFSAIACDSSNFATDIENPEASQVAGKSLYGAFPAAGDLPSKPNMWHWMIGMNAASMNKTGAWLFLKWATSAPTSALMAAAGAPTTRTSAWSSEAYAHSQGHVNTRATMPPPKQTSLRPAVFVGVSRRLASTPLLLG